jgi:hypothetical protein
MLENLETIHPKGCGFYASKAGSILKGEAGLAARVL